MRGILFATSKSITFMTYATILTYACISDQISINLSLGKIPGRLSRQARKYFHASWKYLQQIYTMAITRRTLHAITLIICQYAPFGRNNSVRIIQKNMSKMRLHLGFISSPFSNSHSCPSLGSRRPVWRSMSLSRINFDLVVTKCSRKENSIMTTDRYDWKNSLARAQPSDCASSIGNTEI